MGHAHASAWHQGLIQQFKLPTDTEAEQFARTLAVWNAASDLDPEPFPEHFTHGLVDKPATVARLRQAAAGAAEAETIGQMVDASRPLTQAIRDIGADRWPWVREGLADKAAAAMPMQFAAHVGTTAATVSTGQTGRAAAEKPSNRPNRTSRDHEDQPISSERGISSGLLQLAASGTNLRQTPEGHFELASMFDSEPVPMLDNRGQPVIGASGKPVMIPRLADPRFFVDRGLEGRDALENPSPFLMGLLAVIADLVNFRHNHAWDLQRRNGDNVPKLVDGATVAIGLYGAAAGIPEDVLLAIQDRYAQIRSHFPEGTVMDERYPHLPKRNVENTHIGYELYQSGRIGPSPSRNGL